nr:immunoglobulin heavy chain junction region [Macaca mulatta]
CVRRPWSADAFDFW